MYIRIGATLVAVFLWIAASAQAVSLEDITGAWDYESYAEIETPDNKIPVGAKMDFHSDGTLVMTLSTGKAEATYVLDGDTIIYSDSNGQQVWHIRSYEPGEALVVEYRRALMFFRKSGADAGEADAVAGSFAMSVADVFTVTGKGVVVTGQVKSGAISVGDSVCISGGQPVTVESIEMFRKILDTLAAGDRGGLLLKDISKNDVQKGEVVRSCD